MMTRMRAPRTRLGLFSGVRGRVFSEDGMRRPTPHTQYPEGLQLFDGL